MPGYAGLDPQQPVVVWLRGTEVRWPGLSEALPVDGREDLVDIAARIAAGRIYGTTNSQHWLVSEGLDDHGGQLVATLVWHREFLHHVVEGTHGFGSGRGSGSEAFPMAEQYGLFALQIGRFEKVADLLQRHIQPTQPGDPLTALELADGVAAIATGRVDGLGPEQPLLVVQSQRTDSAAGELREPTDRQRCLAHDSILKPAAGRESRVRAPNGVAPWENAWPAVRGANYAAPVDGSDLDSFVDVAWPDINHRRSQAWLEERGWTKCGEGDWAIALRSPDGALAARVSPFEPSYGWFVELCDRLPGNPYLPRIYFVSELEGGGQLAVLEYLTPSSEAEANAFLLRWKDDADPDPDLRRLRDAVEALDEECRETVRFWMGIDLGARHVMRAADGQVKLIDLLGLAGGPMVEQIEADVEEFLRVIPRHRCRYMLEIPHMSGSFAAEDRAKVTAAFAAYDAADHRRS